VKLQVTINNFKSISSVDLNLKEGLNVLIGPNGSGKTCLLTSLKFLKDLFLFGSAQAMARNGGAKRIYRRGAKVISFLISQDYGDRLYRRRKRPCQFNWEIRISQTGRGGIANVVYEKASIVASIEGKDKVLFEVIVDRSRLSRIRPKVFLCDFNQFGRDLFSIWERIFAGDKKKEIYDAFCSRILKELSKQLRNTTDESVFPRLARFDRELESLYSIFLYMNEYNIAPDIARQSTEQLPFAQMQPNGAAVSEVIHALVNKNLERIELGRYYGIPRYAGYEFGRREFEPYIYYNLYRQPRFFRYGEDDERKTLLRALENINKELSAAVKPIESVNVDTDPTNGRRFVVFRAGEQTFVPEEVSDGTIKWLCILVSIFVPFSSVYILEEPENFLHPWMQQRLIQMMRDHSKSNHTVFILASHSSTVLNATAPDEVIVVSSTDDGTKIAEIEDKEAIEKTLAKSNFRLGDYWVSGALGGVP
jgi:predicted ATPase